jgi:23S rRNA pseudouridine1911/1915/1917 synthase
LVINKPAGLVVHPDGKREGESLVDWILNNYPEMSGVGEPLVMEHKGETVTVDRPGIVHRLDRETSGVLILAKTQNAYEHFKKQFQDHSIRKEYLAIVLGNTNDRGIIDEAIGRNARDIRLWSTGRNTRGMMRAAITRYFTERKFETGGLPAQAGEKFSVVRLFPETGRTHQLRVHMKSIQHPIIGDGLYAPKTLEMLGFDRTALHAYKITFTDLQGIEHTVEAPLPDDFKRVIS